MRTSSAVLSLLVASFLLPSCSLPKESGSPPGLEAPAESPFLYPCSAGSNERAIEYSGFVLLNRNMLPKGKLDTAIQEAIREQRKFLAGYLANVVSNEENQVFLSARESEVKILSRVATNYGLDLKIEPALHAGHPYVVAALARAFTMADDPAWKVSYRARMWISACGRENPLVTVALPTDPYLAYWLAERRPIRNNGTTKRINPCASPELVQMNYSQHYWWLFHPSAKGRDADDRAYDCTESLPLGAAVGYQITELGPRTKTSPSTLGSPLVDSKGPLRVAVIFGSKQYLASAAPEMEAALAVLLKQSPGTLAAAIAQTPPAAKHQHREAFRFLSFLAGLGDTVEITEQKLEKGKESLRLVWKGRLRRSGRELSLDIYFGSTDTTPALVAQHWPRVLEGFREADVLLYFGRAGLGVNMSLAALAKDLKLSPKSLRSAAAAKPYQLLGIVAPHAYTFFGQDIAGLREKIVKAQRTDLFLTTGTGEPKILLGLLSYLDSLLAGKPLGWGAWAAPNLNPGEHVYFHALHQTGR